MEKLIALLLVGLLFHAAESVQRCDRSNTDPCNEAAVTVVLGTQTQFPDVRFLNAYCSNLNTTIDCIVDEATECPNSRNKDVLAEYVEIQRIIHEICTEGSKFRKSYLESVPCYNRNLDKLRNCSSSIHADVTGFRSSESGVEKPFELRSPFKYECIKMTVVPNCRIRAAAENCEMKAAYVLADLEFGVSNLMKKTLCRKEHMAIWLDEFLSYALRSGQQGPSSNEDTEWSQGTATEEIPSVEVIGGSSSESLENPRNNYVITNLVRAGRNEAIAEQDEKRHS